MNQTALIVAGVQKCGTSSLYNLLALHPLIRASRIKETEFFSVKRNLPMEIPDYLSYFQGEPSSAAAHTVTEQQAHYLLDVSPGYFISPYAPEQINRVFPDARLLFILRDPAERAYSAWLMQQTKGSDLRPFSQAIREEAHYLEHGRYHYHIQRFLAYFSRAQTHIVFLEDLQKEPETILKGIYEFLGLDAIPHHGSTRENVGGIPRSKVVTQLLNLFFRARNTVRRTPFAVLVDNEWVDRRARRLRNRIASWNRIRGRKPDSVMRDSDKSFIIKSLEPEIEAIQELCKKDLSYWQ